MYLSKGMALFNVPHWWVVHPPIKALSTALRAPDYSDDGSMNICTSIRI
jgi:hypothetical protein